MIPSLNFREILELVGGRSSQEISECSFSGVASLKEAGSKDVSFLGNDRYRPQLATTRAGLVILPEGESPPDGATFIPVWVEVPNAAFSKVVARLAKVSNPFSPGIQPGAILAPSAELDPTKVRVGSGAVIGEEAVIGSGTEIGPNVVIGNRVKIGDNCHLHANSSVREDCILGSGVILQPGAIIGSDGFGYESSANGHQKIPQIGNVVLEDEVEIGANTCVDRARFGTTRIGRGTKIDNLVQIGHNAEIGSHCLIVSQTGIAGSAKINDFCTVAAQVGIGGHVEIGPHVTLTARTGASKNITIPGVYMGTPARPMRQIMKQRALVARLPKILANLRKDLKLDEAP